MPCCDVSENNEWILNCKTTILLHNIYKPISKLAHNENSFTKYNNNTDLLKKIPDAKLLKRVICSVNCEFFTFAILKPKRGFI